MTWFDSLSMGSMFGTGVTEAADKEEPLDENARCKKTWGLSLDEENKLLEQLVDELLLETDIPENFDNNDLRRYLRARKHNIYKAKQMILDTLKWRGETKVDDIYKNFEFPEKEEFHQHYPEGFYNTDRQGRPLYLQRPGNINITELWKFTTLDRTIKYHITQQERCLDVICPASSVAAGTLHMESLVIIDMDNVGVSTITGEVRKVMAKIMQIDQDYYPEMMWKSVIINAPTSFRVIWSMIKYLLDARTQAKIEVCSTDYREKLFKYVDPSQLPVEYGGTCTAKLIESPGPWQDPEIMAEVERRHSLRQVRKMGTANGYALGDNVSKGLVVDNKGAANGHAEVLANAS